jgi:cobalt-precorrin-7 (C5)-methyltransferase
MAVNKIAIVGCGPGALACVTGEARDAIARADVLVGTEHLLKLFPESHAARIVVHGSVDAAVRAVIAHRDAAVAVLVTGDPGIASIARGVVAHFGPESCRLIPGISSIQVAFARLGLDWMDARIVSAHNATPSFDYSDLARESKIAVLSGSANAGAWAAGLADYLGTRWRLYVAQDLTLESECVREVSVTDLRDGGFSARSVLILVRSEQK